MKADNTRIVLSLGEASELLKMAKWAQSHDYFLLSGRANHVGGDTLKMALAKIAVASGDMSSWALFNLKSE